MIINNNYPNQDEMEYDTWIRSVEHWGILKYMHYILDDLDCTVIVYRGMRKIHTKDCLYSKLINRYNKCLTRIKNPIKYNYMVDLLEKRHKDNLEFEEFEDKPKYVYSNLKTGECIVSDNPNLLEELNTKKKKEKKQKVKLPKFNFKIEYK